MIPESQRRRKQKGSGVGLIINPRGTNGSGKTEFVRRILADYGWGESDRGEPIHRVGRGRPIGYRLRHPLGRRPLVVLGHYERISGGCDTISAKDGGLDEAFRLADAWAAAGHDVLFEGSTLSAEHERSASLAHRHTLHILCLATPPGQAARNLVARRRTRRDSWPLVARGVVAQLGAVEAACHRLRPIAAVHDLTFDDALCLARDLLGLGLAAAATELSGSVHPGGLARMTGGAASLAPHVRCLVPDAGHCRTDLDAQDPA